MAYRRGWQARSVALAAIASLSLAGCSGGSSSVVRRPTRPIAPTTSAAPTSLGSRPARHPTILIVPAQALRDGQQVQVRASGFSADEALQVVQCAAKQNATGPGDCNLTAMLAVSSDATGRLVAVLPVARGPFGANNIVCGARQACLISVTQASLSPTEEADAPITFATS